MKGYIMISRSIIENEIWDKPPLYLKVWLFLIIKAQHTDFKSLKRGQLIVSIPEIIEACSYFVGYRKEKPSKKQILGILKWMRNTSGGTDEGDDEGDMIETTKVTHGILVTICNYNIYQDPNFYGGTKEGRAKVSTKESREYQHGNNKNNNENNENQKKRVETSTLKSGFGRKGNVMLSESEYQGIKDHFRDHAALINYVSNYLSYCGKSYSDHEALVWAIGTNDKWAVNIRNQTTELSQEEIEYYRAESLNAWN